METTIDSKVAASNQTSYSQPNFLLFYQLKSIEQLVSLVEMTKLSIIFICFASKFDTVVLIFHQTFQKKEEKGLENIMVENGMYMYTKAKSGTGRGSVGTGRGHPATEANFLL